MIGVPVTVVLLLIGGSIAAAVQVIGNSVSSAKTAATSYGQALQEQRYDAAYAMRCSERAGDHDDFVAHWDELSSTGHGVESFKIVGVSTKSLNGRQTAKVNVDVHYADGLLKRETMTLTKQGGTWKACD